ncbi:hypothetical protein LXA43DRAFT_434698 [Ganoderma leucocontextum]|nr:hypothetical protein LXA43DRAFT_434698 [Ganoderma leucocontextum]
MHPLFPRSFIHFRRRYCDKCCKGDSKFRCAGCQAVVYCSRECQKAAWRSHKSECSSEPNVDLNLQASHLGYPSSLSLLNALDEWIDTRRWCLYTLMCALVQLEGGVDAVLADSSGIHPARTSQKALILHVVPAHCTEHDGNPALSFRLGHASIAHKDSEGFLRANWGAIEENAKLASTPFFFLANLLGSEKRDDVAAPVGILPVVYIVHGTDIVNRQAFTLYHLPLRYVDGNLKDVADGRTRAACQELVEIMKDALSKPFVYMRAENLQRPEPDWGIYERTGTQMKKWRWRQLPADRKSWRMWDRLTDELLPGRTSCLTPRQVLTLFDFGQLTGARW